jgi:hypothetical protein
MTSSSASVPLTDRWLGAFFVYAMSTELLHKCYSFLSKEIYPKDVSCRDNYERIFL